LQTLGEAALGNWPEVRAIGDRFNSVAWACNDVSANVQSAIGVGETDWTGNAADGAFAYLYNLDQGIMGEYYRNEKLAEAFSSTADDVLEIFKFLSGLVTDWVDKLLKAAAASLLAGSTEEIPLVDIFTDGYAAYTIYDAIKDGYEIYEKAGQINEKIQWLIAALKFGSDGEIQTDSPTGPIPNVSYNPPLPGK
jgi:hypothetical protein